jgi:type II secretory pathway pseudopilin PulG
MTRRPRAFTVLELLVVIGAITILIGILFVSIGIVNRSVKGRTTAAQLGNTKGLLADLEAMNGLRVSPPSFLWWSSGTIVDAVATAPKPPSPDAYTPDLFHIGLRNPNKSSGDPLPMDPPRFVDTDHPAERSGSPAVVNTSIAMTMFAAAPVNRTRLQNLPQSSSFVPTWSDGMVTAPTGAQVPLRYAPGAQVQFGVKFYIAGGTFSVSNNPPPSAGPPWIDVTAFNRIAPMLLDGWNNPIILVPASGLLVTKTINGAQTPWIEVSPEGKVQANGTPQMKVVQIGRPFFASAGPDGDFSTGDDNVYSHD